MSCDIVRHRAPSGAEYAHVEELKAGTLPLPVAGAEIDFGDVF